METCIVRFFHPTCGGKLDGGDWVSKSWFWPTLVFITTVLFKAQVNGASMEWFWSLDTIIQRHNLFCPQTKIKVLSNSKPSELQTTVVV
jgi:hypothetical protein